MEKSVTDDNHGVIHFIPTWLEISRKGFEKYNDSPMGWGDDDIAHITFIKHVGGGLKLTMVKEVTIVGGKASVNVSIINERLSVVYSTLEDGTKQYSAF